MGMKRGIMGSKWITAVAGITNLICVCVFINADKPVHAIAFAIVFLGMCVLMAESSIVVKFEREE
jgi:hypothetical protein